MAIEVKDILTEGPTPKAKESVPKHPMVNLEDVLFLEIEMFDNPAPMTKEIEEKNAAFLTRVLVPELTRRVRICECRMQEVMARTMRKASLMNVDPRTVSPQMDEADIAANRFGVLVTSEHGLYTGIACVVNECANCHRLELYGDVTGITKLIAKNLVSLYSSEQPPSGDNESPSDNMEGMDVDELLDLIGDGASLDKIMDDE